MKKTTLLGLLTAVFLFFSSSQISQAATIFNDNFTGADGTNLEFHNSHWDQYPGFAEIHLYNNKAITVGGSNAIYRVKDHFSQADQCVSADVDFPLPTFFSLLARINSGRSQYYYFAFNPDGTSSMASHVGIFYNETTPLSDGTHNVKLCAIGDQIYGYVDNTLVHQETNTDVAVGTGEFSTGNSSGTTFDNFRYTDGGVSTDVRIKVIAATSSATVGAPFTVDVNIVDEADPTFNAAQATVAVSSNLTVLNVTNPSTGGCNFQYTQTPTTSNPSFAGAIPGTDSTGCTVYRLTLQPNATGSGTIAFTDASVKNYEDSSEMLTGVTNGSFTLVGAAASPSPTPPLTQVTVTSPEVTYHSTFNLGGLKTTDITSVFVNGSSADSTYPTSTSWLTPVTLTLGDNTFTIYGSDALGNQTATFTTGVNLHTLGDINGDGNVDLIDASLFGVDWGKTSDLTYILSDMNDDGNVDLTDLSILARLETE